MASDYLDKARGNKFLDLVETGDKDFKKDLVKFFSGGRYNLSVEEMKEIGYEGLANKFVDHMRWQSVNETTAAKDLYYATNDEYAPEGQVAFGRLMEAYDESDGGGTGFWGGVADYGLGVLASPSTAVSIGTLGFGAGSKIAAKGTIATAQVAVRKALTDKMASGLSREAAKAAVEKEIQRGVIQQGARVLPGSTLAEMGRSAAITGAFEGSIGGAMTYAAEETREETIEDYDYTWGDVALGATVSAATGIGLGAAGGYAANRSKSRVYDVMLKRSEAEAAKIKAAKENIKKTMSTLESLTDEQKKEVAGRTTRLLETLDPDLVIKGDELRELVLTTGDVDKALSPRGLSLDTLKGITAASVDLGNKLQLKPGQRVSSAVYEAIERGDLQTDELLQIADRYGLSQEQLGLVWLSDVSEAGRTLGQASAIKGKLKAAGTDVANLTKKLRERGIASPADETIRYVSKKREGSSVPGANFFRNLDATSIAFMTTQFGTTSANIIGSGFNTAANVSDEFFKGLFRAARTGDVKQMSGALDILRGLSWDDADAKALMFMLANDKPDTYERVFYDSLRSDGVLMDKDSVMLRGARVLNYFNSVSDTVFKRGVFFGELNRGLRESGTNVKEFLDSGKSLDQLPEGVFDRAVEKAREITMQRRFEGDDVFSGSSRAVEDLARKVPFLMSQVVGVAFPRYMANHLKQIVDYTPGLGLMNLTPIMPKANAEDVVAKQLTGTALAAWSGYLYSQGILVDYDEIRVPGAGEEGGTVSLKRALGPWMMNMYLGEMAARYYEARTEGQSNEEALKSATPPTLMKDFLDISVGMTDLGFEPGIAADLIKAYKGDISKADAAGRSLGRWASTFTYPAATFRDVVGQYSGQSVTTPYTRRLQLGSPEEVLKKPGMTAFSDRFWNEFTRFLPDTKASNFLSSSNSRENGYELPYYTIFNPRRIGSPDPIVKQMGLTPQGPRTDLQKEILELNLTERDLEKRLMPISGALNYLVRRDLSDKLHKTFNIWKDQPLLPGKKSYSELTDDASKRQALEAFVDQAISVTREKNKDFLMYALNNIEKDPALARRAGGFLREMNFTDYTNKRTRNQYLLAINELTDQTYEDPEDYFSDSSSIEEEFSKRLSILDKLEKSPDVLGARPEVLFEFEPLESLMSTQ